MINDTSNVKRYRFNKTVKQYSIPFRFWNDSEIAIYVYFSDSTEALLVNGVDYTLTNKENNRFLTLSDEKANLEDATYLVIQRTLAFEQAVDLYNGHPIDAEILEEALDKLTCITQQLNEKLERALLFNLAETKKIVVPLLENKAGKILGFDRETGESIELYEGLEQSAERAEAAAVLAKDNAESATVYVELARKWACAEEEIEENLYSARHYLEETKKLFEIFETLTIVDAETVNEYFAMPMGEGVGGVGETISGGAISSENIVSTDEIDKLF